MRVFKTTYSKPKPKGLKVETEKATGRKYVLQKSKRLYLTKDGSRVLCECKTWLIEFLDHKDIQRRIKAYSDKVSSDRDAGMIQLLINCKTGNTPIDSDVFRWIQTLKSSIRDELISYGLIDAQQKVIGEPLSYHVDEYIHHLRKKERNSKYVKTVRGDLTHLFCECGFVMFTDISAPKLKDFLDSRRDMGRGISKRRYNGILVCIKGFCKWMVITGNATTSPIQYLSGMDKVKSDIRRKRRTLGLNELRHLLETTLQSKKIVGGLSGYERNLLYRLSIESGLRPGEISRLLVKDFNFTEASFVVRGVPGTKNIVNETAYLKPQMSLEIQQYCRSKLPNAPFINMPKNPVDLIKPDLEAAGIAYCVDGEYFDYYALRHQHASMMKHDAGADEETRMASMRHTSIAMTDRYTHAREAKQRAAVENLPDLTMPSREAQVAIKTGTDDVTENFLSKSCFKETAISEISEISTSRCGDSRRRFLSSQLPPTQGGGIL